MLGALNWDWFVGQVKDPWVLFGFLGQGVFFMRFAVQWVASERRGRSHIPISFWYFSIIGGLITLVYAVKIGSLVFMVSQALALFIYVRNLMLIYRPRVEHGPGFPVVGTEAAAKDVPTVGP